MNQSVIAENAQYLTFILDEELYAFDISQVQSVLDYEKVTKVPKTPDFMRGVINLRGNVVPVVDLRRKFGMPPTEQTVDACIIIVEVLLDGEMTILGTLADSVSEVMELAPDAIEPAPKIGTRLDTAFIKGMGKRHEAFVIILDLDRIFSAEELMEVQDAAEPEPPKIKSAGKTKRPEAKHTVKTKRPPAKASQQSQKKEPAVA